MRDKNQLDRLFSRTTLSQLATLHLKAQNPNFNFRALPQKIFEIDFPVGVLTSRLPDIVNESTSIASATNASAAKSDNYHEADQVRKTFWLIAGLGIGCVLITFQGTHAYLQSPSWGSLPQIPTLVRRMRCPHLPSKQDIWFVPGSTDATHSFNARYMRNRVTRF